MESPPLYSVKPIPAPTCWQGLPTPVIPDVVMQQRLQDVLHRMQQQHLDWLAIYADKEHGATFAWLSGFIPRFEEALLLISATGALNYVMGNENLKLVPHARNPGNCLHSPLFSLPNQPMEGYVPLEQLFRQAGIQQGAKVGVVGWKLFTQGDASQCFDIPSFILDALSASRGGREGLVNATGLFVSPGDGLRCINRACDIAFAEYGANLASTSVLRAMDAIAPGVSEKAIGQLLAAEGQPHSVISIAASGDRFSHATLYPRDKLISKGDKFSLTTAYRGGLTSRAAYVAESATDLPAPVSDWLSRVAIPYYHTVVTWLETLRTGISGDALYQTVERVLPKAQYHWHLNPGHLVADEEWLCSPIYAGSTVVLQSGMLLQIDIIPSVAGYGGASIEDTVALADETLRQELARDFPAVWQRMQQRKNYLSEVLNLQLHDDVLLLSNSVGYLRPWLMNKEMALVRQ